jgi:hypothetical protein
MRAYTTISRTRKTIVIAPFVFLRDELVIGVRVVKVILIDARDLGEDMEESPRDEDGEVFLGTFTFNVQLIHEFANDRVEGKQKNADPHGFFGEAHCFREYTISRARFQSCLRGRGFPEAQRLPRG